MSRRNKGLRNLMKASPLPCMREWWEQNIVQDAHVKAMATTDARQAEIEQMRVAFTNEPPVWREPSQREIKVHEQLVKMASHGSRGKRFLRSLTEQFAAARPQISIKQSVYLWMLADWKQKQSKVLRALIEDRAQELKNAIDGTDWRPNETLPEDYYAL